MYFWSMKELKQKLLEDGLTEGQAFYYIIVFVGLYSIALELVAYAPVQPGEGPAYLDSLVNIAIPVVGTFVAFVANGGKSGVGFAERYFSISLVATLRFMVMAVPLFALVAFYWLDMYEKNGSIHWSAIENAVYYLWYVGLYLYIAKSIRDVAKA